MIKVTDHALVRFLERSGGADVEGIRQTLSRALERARRGAERAGIANYTILVDGLRYVVSNGVLVTVLTDEMPVSARRGRPR